MASWRTSRPVRCAEPAARHPSDGRCPEPARKGWRPATMGVDEPACVLFTSGSTGRPKSIVNSQRNLLQRVAQSINAAHINADGQIADARFALHDRRRPRCHDRAAGRRKHSPPRSARRRRARDSGCDPRGGHHHPVRVSGSSAVHRSRLVDERAGASLRLVRVGGDTTLWSDIETLRAWLAPEAAIQLIYAATEAPMMQWFVDDACRREDARIPIGYPLPGNRLALVDEEGGATPPGEVGELIVASPYVSLGRWVEGRLADESVETRWRMRMPDLSYRRPRAPEARRAAGASRPQGQASQDTRVSRRSRRRRSHASRTPIRARCRRDGTAERRRWHDDARRICECARWSAFRADRRIEGIDALRAAADAPGTLLS